MRGGQGVDESDVNVVSAPGGTGRPNMRPGFVLAWWSGLYGGVLGGEAKVAAQQETWSS